ncbi:MAG: DNA repair protein RecO [Gammaproteobacteria bacterium]|nr:DNA repair protein RecO [Gammaproteobacteria bacterium]
MRVTQEAAYVLHSRNYGETSLLVELFTRHYGRIGAVAKGARKKQSKQGSLFSLFQPIIVGWSGKGELVTITQCESERAEVPLDGEALFCGFYLNELILNMLHRFDPHEALYDNYGKALVDLRGSAREWALRIFEKRLFSDMGYGLVLDHNIANNRPIDPESDYVYIPDKGPVPLDISNTISANSGSIRLKGKSLLALANETIDGENTKIEIKHLMRELILHHTGGKPIHSRHLLKSLRDKKVKPDSREILNG